VYDYDLLTPSGEEYQPASPGDTVVASIFETSNTTQAEIQDLTNGQFWLDYCTTTSDSRPRLSTTTPTPVRTNVVITTSALKTASSGSGFQLSFKKDYCD
jgi:hypothetical protein